MSHTILIADDSLLVREALCSLFEREEDFNVCGEAENGRDPARITVPTMIIHGERDYAAKEEDLLPFYSQLRTHDKAYVLLPDGGHALMLEKDHRRFQHEVLSFFDRP